MMEKMQQQMMKMYQMFAWLGLVIVLIAFAFSLQAAGANGTFFSVSKATREAAGAGTVLATANVTRHVLPTWVPNFKFLGLGIMLGSITMALGVIALTLRSLGGDVMARWPAELNPGLPEKPRSSKMFPMLMMLGWLILLVATIWSLAFSGTVAAYWNHAIATELNPAGPGSALLNQLRTIQATLPWLKALRFVGMAFLFTAITVALTVIIRTLQHQEASLQRFLKAQ